MREERRSCHCSHVFCSLFSGDEEAEGILWINVHKDMGVVPCPCGQEYYKLVTPDKQIYH